MDSDVLKELLIKARARNKSLSITGMLLYSELSNKTSHQGRFAQIIEGEREKIQELFSSIREDERHFDIEVLLENNKIEKDFPDWTMGFLPLNKSDFNSEDDFFEFHKDISVNEFEGKAAKAIHLMKMFYDQKRGF